MKHISAAAARGTITRNVFGANFGAMPETVKRTSAYTSFSHASSSTTKVLPRKRPLPAEPPAAKPAAAATRMNSSDFFQYILPKKTQCINRFLFDNIYIYSQTFVFLSLDHLRLRSRRPRFRSTCLAVGNGSNHIRHFRRKPLSFLL